MSRVHVDWTRCDGHGLCVDLLPELLTRDEWGFPVLHGDGEVSGPLAEHARRAEDLCPVLALRLVR